MALDTSLPSLLKTLTESLSAASESTPDASSLPPPKDGISLLDVKNELLLSYLQNLVFLIVLKLRERRIETDEQEQAANLLDDSIVQKLVEARVYLEKGVRPLEGRLKYQIDKVLRAADDAAKPLEKLSVAAQKSISTTSKADQDISDEDDGSDTESIDRAGLQPSEVDDLQYRPNPSSLLRPAAAVDETAEREERNGLYKPPRITATAMPTTGPKEKEARKSAKSATLDEFVNTELSSAPFAEPSIGSTIVSGGRRSKSERERKDEAERKEYEEKNYTRLPKESKKERAKKGGRKDAGYGGEEWRGLGEGIDRIERLTTRKAGEGRSVLEKSRKRSSEDGPKSSGGGIEVGQGFQKRLKTLDSGRRDRGRGPK